MPCQQECSGHHFIYSEARCSGARIASICRRKPSFDPALPISVAALHSYRANGAVGQPHRLAMVSGRFAGGAGWSASNDNGRGTVGGTIAGSSTATIHRTVSSGPGNRHGIKTVREGDG
jgi:hypothetical protein